MNDGIVARTLGAPAPNLLDQVDMMGVHFFVCLLGVFLCLYVMQLIATGAIRLDGDCTLAYYARRAALWLLALSLCWAMFYSSDKHWQPWPPDVFVIGSIDLLLLSAVVVAIRRRRALG